MSHAATNRRHVFRPRVVVLEDRCVPSTLTVTSSADIATQDHTLRYAVAHAQSGDTILLTAAVRAPIVLTQGELILSRDVTIMSVPSRTPTISGGGASRVFEVAAGAHVNLVNLNLIGGNGLAGATAGSSPADGNGGAVLNFGALTVDGCTLSGNAANASFGFGGAILNDNGTLTVIDSTLSGNSAANGGAIADFGSLTVSDSTLESNSAANGGAISITGSATVTDATVSNNSSVGVGGGIFCFSGSLTLSDSVVAGNSSSLGGGLVNQFGTMIVTDSVIAGNRAGVGGGGIFTFDTSSTFISRSLLQSNTAGFGGAISNAGYLQVGESLVVGNTALSASGGGIDSIGVVVINDTLFKRNRAAAFGGALSSAGVLFVSASTFVENSAAQGGAIANFAFLWMSANDFHDNSPDDILGG
ncbi:hypothetical protein [Planctomyces sp. SH-PL62]|uniref:hypothetical protein n=1 Tax=Planctomyces sp. SH-PL62 TaxID=1636152 RepID=UPI000838E1E7|nr:hypothetical protein [Planctomyces sp. SH-PL62]